jgi:hypothetical protein
MPRLHHPSTLTYRRRNPNPYTRRRIPWLVTRRAGPVYPGYVTTQDSYRFDRRTYRSYLRRRRRVRRAGRIYRLIQAYNNRMRRRY